MRRMVLFACLCGLTGCGVDVSKNSGKSSKSTVVAPPEAEVYDKVAPMPREAKPKR